MIDRKALVSRHDPLLRAADPFSPLSVGNGEFAFTADITGAQTLLPRQEGATPLCTMSQWGWHSYPGQDEPLRLAEYRAGERTVGYMTDPAGQEESFTGLRVSPHRLNLARIGFAVPGSSSVDWLSAGDIRPVDQRLSLFEGRLSSSFEVSGMPVNVVTLAHGEADAVSFRVESPLLARSSLCLALSFPYGSHQSDASDWSSPEKHRTDVIYTNDPESRTAGRAESGQTMMIRRRLDEDSYVISLRTGAGGLIHRSGAHEFSVSSSTGVLELTVLFSPSGALSPNDPDDCPSFPETEVSSRARWLRFWTTGAAIELAESADPRALELERRIVLSRYLTAIQCSGSLPPQETGLTCNSWYGKFHLEMHYWHAAHFPLWGNSDLLLKSLDWYRRILGSARERAGSQGYRGARWPKMTDPSGRDSPSPIGPLLCWQEPHPVMYAELLRLSGVAASILEGFSGIVFETAEFMADYVLPGKGRSSFDLAPPLIPAQESHRPLDTLNPCFELEYWRWALETAARFIETFAPSLARGAALARWRNVASRMAALPTGKTAAGNTVYLSHERCPSTFTDFARDHPSMLLACGMLPGQSVDRQIMSATYDAVLENWDFNSAWGWDFPAMAMTAARLGRPHDAVDALLMDTPKNTYRPNGHNAQLSKPAGEDSSFLWTTALPLYLPGNGALLLASGMMASGWSHAGEAGKASGGAPGFPCDGSWTVRQEGFTGMP